MSDQTNNQALNGLNPLAYLGVNPKTPPNFYIRSFPPSQYDSKNVQIGALWLNTGNSNPPTTPPTINDLYVLVALYGGLATWLPFSAGDLQFLTGNTGGPVPPTAHNINVVGDGTTITIAGNPGTSTLTVSVVGTGVLSTLTGNSGGAVFPLAGNINVVGTGVITVVGNPGTHTLTVTPSGSIASSFITNPATGTATPAAGVLTFAGTGGISVSAAGSTVTITASGTPATQCAFLANKTANAANVTGDGTQYTIIFDHEFFDLSNNYNSATGTFTAPTTGTYSFIFCCSLTNVSPTVKNDVDMILTVNGGPQQYLQNNQGIVGDDASNVYQATASYLIALNSGDTVQCSVVDTIVTAPAKTVGVMGNNVNNNDPRTTFAGFRVDPSASFITGAETFITDSGTATPNILGEVNVLAQNATLGAGSSVKFTAPGSSNTIELDVTDTNNNTIIGKSSGNLTLTSTHCSVFGASCGTGLTSGSSNIFIGYQAGTATTAITSGAGNTIIGDASAIPGLVAPSATVNGFYALGASVGTGGTPTTPFLHNFGGDLVGNTFLGYNAGSSFNAGQKVATRNNTGVGQSSLESLTSGNNNVCVGYQAGSDITTGTENVCVGVDAGFDFSTGTGNTLLGFHAGNNLTGAESNNVLISSSGITGASGLIQVSLPTYGTWAHNFPGVGSAVNGENIYIGTNAGSLTTNNTTVGNIGIGANALASMQNSVGGNIAIGDVGLFYLTTGVQNTCIGKDVGVNSGGATGLVTGSYNSWLGFTAGLNYTSSESSNVLIGSQGVVGDNNTCRIGAATGAGNSQLNKTFIHGIRGITTGVADAIAVLIDSAGQLGTVSSSIRYKDNVESMDEESSPIMHLRPVTFTWKHDNSNKQNLGLIAEEVEEVMPQLVVYDQEGKPETVKYHDLPVLILNELKKLSDRVRELEEKIEELEFN